MPTRGLEPPHLAVIDPKSIASANSATSARVSCGVNYLECTVQVHIKSTCRLRLNNSLHLLYSHLITCANQEADNVPPILSPVSSSVSELALAICGVLGVTQLCPHCCDEIQLAPNPLALLPVARSPSRAHCCTRWWALTPPFHPLPTLSGTPGAPSTKGRESFLLRL